MTKGVSLLAPCQHQDVLLVDGAEAEAEVQAAAAAGPLGQLSVLAWMSLSQKSTRRVAAYSRRLGLLGQPGGAQICRLRPTQRYSAH